MSEREYFGMSDKMHDAVIVPDYISVTDNTLIEVSLDIGFNYSSYSNDRIHRNKNSRKKNKIVYIKTCVLITSKAF